MAVNGYCFGFGLATGYTDYLISIFSVIYEYNFLDFDPKPE
jgi:hypothetical protein